MTGIFSDTYEVTSIFSDTYEVTSIFSDTYEALVCDEALVSM